MRFARYGPDHSIPAVALALALAVAGCMGATGPTDPASPSAPAPSPSAPSAGPSPAASTVGTETAPTSTAAPSDVPSRIVASGLGIDLPVISGAETLPNNPPDYPLCDVAQYLTTFPYPGRAGTTTWIYGHARPGMLLPLLEASERDDGAELLGQIVDVYSTASTRYRYRISLVLRHATDRSAAVGVAVDGGRLVLQTSEGPKGTIPKLQVVADLIAIDASTVAESQPSAAPRECSTP